jgi:hypothetical protein
LTPEQAKKYDEMKAAMRNKMGQGRGKDDDGKEIEIKNIKKQPLGEALRVVVFPGNRWKRIDRARSRGV